MTIRTKILLSLAFATFLSVGGTSIIVFYQSSQTAVQDFQINALAQMHRMEEYINLVLGNTKDIISTIKERELIRNSLGKTSNYLNLPKGQDIKTNYEKLPNEEQKIFDELLTFGSIFPTIAISYLGMEDGGFTQAPDDLLSTPFDPRTRIWYKNSKNNPDIPILSEVYISTNNLPTFTLSEGIYDNNKKFIGVAAVDFYIADLAKDLAEIAIGETGHVIVTEQSGTIIIDKDDPARLYKKTNEVNIPALEQLFALTEGILDIKIDGLDHLGAVYTTKNNWKIIMLIERSELIATATATATKTLTFGMFLGLLIMAMGVFIAKSIARPIALLSDTSAEVASGKMQALDSLPVFKGELFALQNSMKSMVAQLIKSLTDANAKTQAANDALEYAKTASDEAKQAQAKAELAKREGTLFAAQQLEGISQHVATATTSLLSQVSYAADGATQQDAKVENTAYAMHELNNMITEINDNTRVASDMSAQTRKKAEESQTGISQAITEIQRVQKESQELKADMNLLAEQAQAINQVMNVIVDIADQTNLLALNAAIEAARAGEAGRGFAVVADEVRKLAEKTTHSTSEVGISIRTIQQSTQRSMQQVDSTNQSIERATELVQKSGVDLNEIVHFADSTADKIQSISVTSNEQQKASSAINDSLIQVSSIATKTKENMQESTKLIAELNTQSTELSNLIKKLKEE